MLHPKAENELGLLLLWLASKVFARQGRYNITAEANPAAQIVQAAMRHLDHQTTNAKCLPLSHAAATLAASVMLFRSFQAVYTKLAFQQVMV